MPPTASGGVSGSSSTNATTRWLSSPSSEGRFRSASPKDSRKHGRGAFSLAVVSPCIGRHGANCSVTSIATATLQKNTVVGAASTNSQVGSPLGCTPVWHSLIAAVGARDMVTCCINVSRVNRIVSSEAARGRVDELALCVRVNDRSAPEEGFFFLDPGRTEMATLLVPATNSLLQNADRGLVVVQEAWHLMWKRVTGTATFPLNYFHADQMKHSRGHTAQEHPSGWFRK